MLSTELKEVIRAHALKLASKLHAEYDHMNEVPLQKLATDLEALAHELYEEYLFLSLPLLEEWARYYAECR